MTPLDFPDYPRKLEHLLQVCKDLPAALELEPLLNAVIEEASMLTRSEWSQILVYDPELKFMKVIAAPFFMLDTLKTVAVPVDRSIAGYVMETQTAMVYHASASRSDLFATLDWEIHQNARSVLAVPLFFKNEVVGVLESVNKADDAAYVEEDVFFLNVLASQAATAIQNQRLLQRSEHAVQKIMEVDRMKSDFIAITSHELRTPLGVILGRVALLEEHAAPEQKEHLEIINRSTERLRTLINECSDMDAVTRGFKFCKREMVHIEEVVPDVVERMQTLAQAQQIRLTADVKQPSLCVEGDLEKITLALVNIVKNAITFTNPGGLVKVSADALPGYVKIAVLDSGIGIPAAEQQNIFKRFYQVEKHLTRRHGGMGLGLFTAKEMVEMHGGRITVESVENKGSRFTILLPVNAAQAAAAGKLISPE